MGILERIKRYINQKGGLWARGNFDMTFFVVAMIIAVIGVLMLYSATFVVAYTEKEGDTEYFFKRQLLFLAIGIVCIAVISMVNYNLFGGWFAVLAVVSTVTLMFATRLFPMYNGTYRYIDFGSFQFQPSEFGKIALILALASLLSKRQNMVRSDRKIEDNIVGGINNIWCRISPFPITESWITAVYSAVVIALFIVALFVEKHLSCIIIFGLLGVGILYAGGFKKRWFPVGLILVIIAGFILLKTGVIKDYQLGRITTFLGKETADVTNERWQTMQGLYAIASGGLFGKGIGRSTSKQMYVPEPQNDMIFSIVVEELGLVGAAVIILLFGILIWRGIVISIHAKNRFGSLVALGITLHIAIQLIMNLAVVTDIMPNTGVPLPFFSAGGSATVGLMIEVGIMISISKSASLKKEQLS